MSMLQMDATESQYGRAKHGIPTLHHSQYSLTITYQEDHALVVHAGATATQEAEQEDKCSHCYDDVDGHWPQGVVHGVGHVTAIQELKWVVIQEQPESNGQKS